MYKSVNEQEERINNMTDEERREYLQERNNRGNKKIIIIAVVAIAVFVLIFCLVQSKDHEQGNAYDKEYSDAVKQEENEKNHGDSDNKNHWEYFNEQNVIGSGSDEVEAKYGYLNLRNSEKGTCWQDFTIFGDSFYFVEGTGINFAMAETEEKKCEGMSGTAEEIFGITSEISIDELSNSISPDMDFKIQWKNDAGYKGWYAGKNGDASYGIYLYPDSLQSISYVDKYDPFSDEWDEIPDATSKNYNKVFKNFDGDPTIIYPYTYVVIIDEDGTKYEDYNYSLGLLENVNYLGKALPDIFKVTDELEWIGDQSMGSTWQHFTDLGRNANDLYALGDTDITLGFENYDGYDYLTCSRIGGTAEELFGVSNAVDIDTFMEKIGAYVGTEQGYVLEWTTDISETCWRGFKADESSIWINGLEYIFLVKVYSEGLKGTYYSGSMESMGSMEMVTTDNIQDYYDGYGNDYNMVYPDTKITVSLAPRGIS